MVTSQNGRGHSREGWGYTVNGRGYILLNADKPLELRGGSEPKRGDRALVADRKSNTLFSDSTGLNAKCSSCKEKTVKRGTGGRPETKLRDAPRSRWEAAPLTVEVDRSDILQEEASLHRVHAAAHASAAGTQILVHAVQRVGHGVHRVDHKLDLPLLLVVGVPADPLLPCRHGRQLGLTQTDKCGTASARVCVGVAIPVHFFFSGSSLIPGRVSLHLKSSSQNSLNQIFLRLFSRERDVKY